MPSFSSINYVSCVRAVLFVMLFLMPGISTAAPSLPEKLSKPQIMSLGEQMYRNGILPSGQAMKATIRGDVEVDGTVFSCSSCHLRAGLGSFEGGVVTPPTTGKKLYKPYQRPPSLGDVADPFGRYVYAKTVLERPAYNRENLAHALREGMDPAGQIFNDVMPRYALSDSEMSVLIDYLGELSSHDSPGANSNELNFATVVSDEVSPEDRQAMLRPLQIFAENSNSQLAMFNEYKKLGFTPTAEMKYAFRKVTLDVWELKGEPETWRAQLEAFYAKKPVFALLGGISNRDWRPIHDFCEEHRIPSLFPITDLPVISEKSWYTYYFNKGYAQEGEAVARFLNRRENLSADAPILQIIENSSASKALASGFDTVWQELGRKEKIITVQLSEAQRKDAKALVKIVNTHRPGIMLLWTDAETLPFLTSVFTAKLPPRMLFMSSSYLGKKTVTIEEQIRNSIYLTYPYRLTPYVGSNNSSYDAKVPILTTWKRLGDRRIESRTITMLKQNIMRGFNLIYDNLYRDHLLDVMSMQMDLVALDYERMSFGPGQRYVSKGCYIIQLGAGASPELIPRSDWVVH